MEDSAKTKQMFNVAERDINDIIQDLSKPIPESMLQTKKIGGKSLTYVSWFNATRLLDAYAPGWSFEVCQIQHITDNVVMVVQINIPTKDGIISRQASGMEKDSKDLYGDPFSNAESMALRRAAAKFGLGRSLYNN